MRSVDRRIVLLSFGFGISSTALAQGSAPLRPVRLVVPYPPGGPTDVLARIIAGAFTSQTGSNAIVENKPGGAGTIGARLVQSATPDGMTLLLGNNQTHAMAPLLIKDAGYDPLVDFTPVCGIGSFPHVLVSRSGLGFRTMADLIAASRTRDAKLTFGSTGVGSGSHLAMELLLARTGISMQHVPYQGAAQLIGDLIAERLDLSLAILPSTLPGIAAGQLVPIAVASEHRAPQLPNVSTLGEFGLGGANSESWLAIFAPKESPGTAIARHETALVSYIAADGVKSRIEQLGITLYPRLSHEFRAFLRTDIARWRGLIVELGLRAE